MGFRNPLQSAAAVDTGQPSSAGVRVYQQPTATGTRGVVEFRDGIAGDGPSTITATANLIPQQGGGYTAQGGGLVVDAGSWNNTDGGQLELLVADAPLGGYESVARLVSDRIELVAGGKTLKVGDTGWRDLPYAAGWAGGAMRYRVVNGVCFFAINVGRGSWTGGTAVTTFPTGARPVGTTVSDAGGYIDTFIPYDLFASGVLSLPFAGTRGFVAAGSFPVS